MNQIMLSNKNGEPIKTVGELKEILEPFYDDCEINQIYVYYEPDSSDDAKLVIALAG